MIDAGYGLFVVFAVLVGYWINRAQDSYLRAYAAATGTPPLTTASLLRQLLRPWQFIASAPLTRMSAATSARQTDPKLEALRQTLMTRRLFGSAVIFLAFFGYALIHMRH